MASPSESQAPVPHRTVQPTSHPFPAMAALFERSMAALERSLDLTLAELVLADGGEAVHVFTRGRNVAGTIASHAKRSDYSGAVWDSAGGDARVHDPRGVLDPERPADRRLLESGGHALVLVRLEGSGAPPGLLVLMGATDRGFDDSHGLIAPVAEFIGVAADRERLWSVEQTRHQRRVRLESMLPKIAESLDVRQVFAELSGLIQEVIPHDVLAFALLLPDRSGVRVQASTARGVMELPEYRFSNEEEKLDSNWNFLLAYDLEPVDDSSVRARISPRSEPERREVVTRPGPAWMKFITEAGIRSTMRVPIRSKDRPIGGVVFMARSADAFDDEDGIVASRIADQLALGLAHQELARVLVHEDRRQRRVAALEAALPRLGTLEDLDDIAVMVSRCATGILDHDAVAVLVVHSEGSHVHGLVNGVQRISTQVPLDFVEHQYGELMPHGSLRIREIELVDERRRKVRQRIAREPEDLIQEVVASESALQSLKAIGARAELRVAIRQGDELLGVILFASRTPDHFTREDEEIARRFADRVSLRLAQERVEGEQRRATEAAARARELEGRVAVLQRELERFSAHRAIGSSAAWKKALTDAAQVAVTDTTVLVTGESGTGKEVIARYIHRGSKRAKGPFVALNCAALPEQLLESELFGHERGAFTGATEARAGRIEQATGGVLFLDEVGEMSPNVQAKFLRVLQEREYQRVGGTRTLRADVRIVAATNRDPRAAIERGEFREDLYYRLGVFEIHLPPLRERPEDILLLAEAFLAEVGESVGRPAAGFSEEAREQLLVHTWPGNVRELRNAIERAVILCRGGLITREHLPMTVARPVADRVAMATTATAEFPVEGVALNEVERDLVVKALTRAKQNKSQAAKLLGISRGQLYSLMRRYGLTDARR